MTKVESYRAVLRQTQDWDAYLMTESGLPGPRGNIELAQAASLEGDWSRFEGWLAFDPERAPVNSPQEFLHFCGVLGLGALLGTGEVQVLERLRAAANDPRWRTREGVAMALQHWGDCDLPALLETATDWGRGSLLEKRAAAAALCEPRLLKEAQTARRVLEILNEITKALPPVQERRNEEFLALRKGLAYCWSVAAAALPSEGLPAMEAWFGSADKDVRWIMKENLKKQRLVRLDADWCARGLALLSV